MPVNLIQKSHLNICTEKLKELLSGENCRKQEPYAADALTCKNAGLIFIDECLFSELFRHLDFCILHW